MQIANIPMKIKFSLAGNTISEDVAKIKALEVEVVSADTTEVDGGAASPQVGRVEG